MIGPAMDEPEPDASILDEPEPDGPGPDGPGPDGPDEPQDTLAKQSFELLSQVDLAISLSETDFGLSFSDLFGSGDTGQLSDLAIEQTAGRLYQQPLSEFLRETNIDVDQLALAQADYQRFQCTGNETPSDSTECNYLAQQMANDANAIYTHATSLLHDIETADRFGFHQLQLIPSLQHAGAAMIFAQHEWGLALAALDADSYEIDVRRQVMIASAERTMRALDKMEHLWRSHVRDELFDAVQSYSDNTLGQYACYRAPDAQGHAQTDPHCFDSTEHGDAYRRVAEARFENHVMEYTAQQRPTVFDADHDAFRRKLGELIGPVALELHWSSGGPRNDMSCVQVNEPDDPHSWHDNFLCSPFGSGLSFWTKTDGIEDLTRCVSLDSGEDPDSWSNNYLCA
ncbi:MAG: hypothetical protein AAGC55_21350, partial [Myxococcota bacterium]